MTLKPKRIKTHSFLPHLILRLFRFSLCCVGGGGSQKSNHNRQLTNKDTFSSNMTLDASIISRIIRIVEESKES